MKIFPFRLHALRELALGPRNAKQMKPKGASVEEFSETLLLLEVAGAIRFDMERVEWFLTPTGETLLKCANEEINKQLLKR